MKNFVPLLSGAFTALADLLLPRRCLVCGRVLGRWEDHLCIYCREDFPFAHFSSRVHNPMADSLNAMLEALSPEGFHGPYIYATALFLYHSENRFGNVSRVLKYGGNIRAGRYFGAALGREIASSGHLADVDLVVPVPLHPLRRLRRGYNQAEVIAGAVARETGAGLCVRALRRRRRTSTQTRLGAAERVGNVSGAFTPSGYFKRLIMNDFPYSHILVVDDVSTTGATLAACVKALSAILPSGVRVSVATLGCVYR